MINGVARYGAPGLMEALVAVDQTVSVAGEKRQLFLKQETADPDVAQVPLGAAAERSARRFEQTREAGPRARKGAEQAAARRTRALIDSKACHMSLALDEIQDTGLDLRPACPLTARGISRVRAARPCRRGRAAAFGNPAADRPRPAHRRGRREFPDGDRPQPNVPKAVRDGLPTLY
jgi:hypothetical protein